MLFNYVIGGYVVIASSTMNMKIKAVVKRKTTVNCITGKSQIKNNGLNKQRKRQLKQLYVYKYMINKYTSKHMTR